MSEEQQRGQWQKHSGRGRPWEVRSVVLAGSRVCNALWATVRSLGFVLEQAITGCKLRNDYIRVYM